jgi:hypothetical protein
LFGIFDKCHNVNNKMGCGASNNRAKAVEVPIKVEPEVKILEIVTGPQICDECGAEIAQMMCHCEFPHVPLCLNHINDHVRKASM